MFALLGEITIGLQPLTGPMSMTDSLTATFARHDVVRGKPMLQEIGKELDVRELGFFFDESFCTPAVEWLKLMAAYQAREALPLVTGGVFDGARFVVEALERVVLKTGRFGLVTRMEGTLSLLEAPVPSLLDAALGAGRKAAAAIGVAATKPGALK